MSASWKHARFKLAAMIFDRCHNPAEIADLHSRSWQHFYRHIFSNSYLDSSLADDHRKQWIERLSTFDQRKHFLRTVHESDALIAFAYAVLGDEGGADILIENLHVDPSFHGRGIGRKLMAACAEWALSKSRGISVEVFAANPAVRFYERCGGDRVRSFTEALPGGGNALTLEFRWSDPQVLIKNAPTV